MKKIMIVLFIVIGLLQWFVPASMMVKRERVLQKGKAFRFETQPVDPADPFRGRYVQLSFRADTTTAAGGSFERGQKAYAELETDTAGFARIKQLHHTPPATSDYVEVKIFYWLFDSDRQKNTEKLIVEYPFYQFFLDEYKAPQAENIYITSMRDSVRKTYALVHIYKGKGVIKDLIINDRSVYSYFK